MRVISGSARRMPLKTMDGLNTRPTTDRIKETLFNMMHNDIYGSKFLDLFSGSGAIGIEALSRGAQTVYFVENHRESIACIQHNLRFTKLEENAVLLPYDAVRALTGLLGKGICFDFVYMDPPYGQALERDVLKYLKDSDFIDEETIIIIEADKNDNFDDIEDMGYRMMKQKVYKSNQHLFLKIGKANAE